MLAAAVESECAKALELVRSQDPGHLRLGLCWYAMLGRLEPVVGALVLVLALTFVLLHQ